MHANKARGVLIAFLAMIVACSNAGGPVKDRRLQVVATVFPLYDFARAIGGEKVFVTMLIPPGTDARDFELTEDDIEAAGKADIFMFASFEMEQWAYKIINAAAEKTNMVAVETGRGAYMLPALSPYGQVRADLAPALTGKDPGGVVRYDPYIWLDFTNAQKMMDNIAAAFINKDPKNAKLYKKNAGACKDTLAELDKKYKQQLAGCHTRSVLFAGNWAFAYQAQRYGLSYLPAYDLSADAEPAAGQMLALIREIGKQKVRHIFYSSETVPVPVQTMAEDTGAVLLRLSNGQDVSREDIDAGIAFTDLMERNLEKLKTGMVCH